MARSCRVGSIIMTILLACGTALEKAYSSNSKTHSFIGVHGSYNIIKPSAADESMTLSLPGKGDLGGGVTLSYQSLPESLLIQINGDKTQIRQNAPLSPYVVSLTYEDLSARAALPLKTPIWGGDDSIHLWLGYRYLHIGGTDTVPHHLVTNLSLQGLILGTSISHTNQYQWTFMLGLQLFLPHSIHETNQTTGFNPKTIGARLICEGSIPISQRSYLYLGFWYDYLTISYSGSGSRGLHNATDTRMVMGVPLGLRFYF